MPRELQELIQDQLDACNTLATDLNDVDALWRLFVAEDERRERTADRAVYWCDRAEHWRQKYIAMRAERDAAMDGWICSATQQMGVETHLADHQRKIDLSRKGYHDSVARELLESVEFWDLKRSVEESDLGLYG